MHTPRRTLTIAVAVLTLAACGGDDVAPAGTAVPTAAPTTAPPTTAPPTTAPPTTAPPATTAPAVPATTGAPVTTAPTSTIDPVTCEADASALAVAREAYLAQFGADGGEPAESDLVAAAILPAQSELHDLVDGSVVVQPGGPCDTGA